MLNSNLSKPVQLTRKSISTRSSNRKDFDSEEAKSKSPLKRRPSLDESDTKLKVSTKNNIKTEVNLAARPEPISKALIEEARARRASKSLIKQASSSPKTKNTNSSSPKKSTKQKTSLEINEKKVESTKKNVNKKEPTPIEKIIIKSDESEKLSLEIEVLKQQKQKYQKEIEQLKTENAFNLEKIKSLERQKEEYYQNRRNVELSKELLESGHQKNIDKIQNLLKVCRRDLNSGAENRFESILKERNVKELKSQNRKKENDLNIMNLILCDETYEKTYLEQLVMIEESNGNIWGLSSRDLTELNSILSSYASEEIDADYIKTQVNHLSWFLDISFQRNSSISHISRVLDKMSLNKMNFQQFLTHLLIPIFSSSHYSYLDQLFNIFDMDNDSFISLEDMETVIKEIEWEDIFSVGDLNYLLKEMSTNVLNKNSCSENNRNILISKEEFNEFFRSIFD